MTKEITKGLLLPNFSPDFGTAIYTTNAHNNNNNDGSHQQKYNTYRRRILGILCE